MPPAFVLMFIKLKLLRTLLNASVESVWLFSSDRACLKSAQLLCLIEYMPRKCTAILFNQVCLGSVSKAALFSLSMLKTHTLCTV